MAWHTYMDNWENINFSDSSLIWKNMGYMEKVIEIMHRLTPFIKCPATFNSYTGQNLPGQI